MKERIERLTREIEARNAACKQYAYDIACLTDKVRALHVKIDNLTSLAGRLEGAATTPSSGTLLDSCWTRYPKPLNCNSFQVGP
jgi:hypothetical protein